MWQVLFYEDHRGKSPALDYISSLPPPDKVKISNILRLLEEFGRRSACRTRGASKANFGSFALVIIAFSIVYMMAGNL